MKGRRQGSLSDGGARSWGRVQVCARSRAEESRKRRRCLTVGGEGEDSGCQIGSLRLWNLLRSYTKKTHARKTHEKFHCVRRKRRRRGKRHPALLSPQPRTAAPLQPTRG